MCTREFAVCTRHSHTRFTRSGDANRRSRSDNYAFIQSTFENVLEVEFELNHLVFITRVKLQLGIGK